MTDQRHKFAPGDAVVLRQVPGGLLDGLPMNDQRAIIEVVGEPIRFNDYDGGGRAELQFTDRDGVIHLIYVGPEVIEPVSNDL